MEIKRELLEVVKQNEPVDGYYSVDEMIRILKKAGHEIEEAAAHVKEDWYHISVKYENGKFIYLVNNEEVKDLNEYFGKEEPDYAKEARKTYSLIHDEKWIAGRPCHKMFNDIALLKDHYEKAIKQLKEKL